MAGIRWVYDPPGPVADAFLNSDAFVRGIRGPIGSGKSVACCVEIWRRANQQAPGPDGIRRTRWAVIRSTFPELKTTTIKTWHSWFPPNVGQWREQGPPSHHIRTGDVDCEVLFLALDEPRDVAKLLSLELTGAWINEARETPKAVLDTLTGRVGRFPNARAGGCSWSGVLLDTNPPDSDHWWYGLAEEGTPDDFAFYGQPGGLEEGAENLDWLNQTNVTVRLPLGDPERLAQGRRYYERIKAGKTDDWIKVYVDGDYGFAGDGKPVFPEYRDSLHCRPDELVKGFPLVVGLDFGLTPAAVVGQRRADGRWTLRDELVATDMGIARFAEQLKTLLAGKYGGHTVEVWGDPAGDQRAQTDETTCYQMLAAKGVDANPAPSNDFELRRSAVGAALSRLVDGEPGLVVHPDCRTLRKGMAGAYCYRRVQLAGAEKWKDVPDKNQYSHVCFVAGTPISTPDGRRFVERIACGDLVSTPQGPRPVIATGRRVAADLVEVWLSNGIGLICTADHPFATSKGCYSPASALRVGDILVAEGETWDGQPFTPSKSSTAFATIGSRQATTRPTISLVVPTCIGPSGNGTMGHSRRARRACITRTETRPTIASTISSLCRRATMRVIMSWSATRTASTFGRWHSSIRQWPLLHQRRLLAHLKRGLDLAQLSMHAPWSATLAFNAVGTTRSGQAFVSAASALQPVSPEPGCSAVLMTRAASASSAVSRSAATNTSVTSLAPRVVRVKSLPESALVYNLTVDEVHCYYAGGVLVSNCDAAQYLMLGAGEGAQLIKRPDAAPDPRRVVQHARRLRWVA
jgi:hypothetical protein